MLSFSGSACLFVCFFYPPKATSITLFSLLLKLAQTCLQPLTKWKSRGTSEEKQIIKRTKWCQEKKKTEEKVFSAVNIKLQHRIFNSDKVLRLHSFKRKLSYALNNLYCGQKQIGLQSWTRQRLFHIHP